MQGFFFEIFPAIQPESTLFFNELQGAGLIVRNDTYEVHAGGKFTDRKYSVAGCFPDNF
jgi:hypothetical protein